jgi:hypothetical protein
MPTQEPAVTVRRKQSAASKRATLDLLRNKKRQEKEIVVEWPVGDGKTEEVTFLFQSIGAAEWDALVAKHPPTKDQRADGEPFNPDTFGPALLAMVCVEPALTVEDWTEFWNSPDWNRGEIVMFYANAVQLCQQGLNIPFNASA